MSYQLFQLFPKKKSPLANCLIKSPLISVASIYSLYYPCNSGQRKYDSKSVTLNINKSPSRRIYIQSSNVSESSTTPKGYCCASSQNTATSKERGDNTKDGCTVSREKKDKNHIKNVTITSRPSISRFKVNKEYDESLPEEIWKTLYKDSKNVRGRISLPKTWCSHFTEIINKVSPYSCINFVCHTVPKITKHLFTCDFFVILKAAK